MVTEGHVSTFKYESDEWMEKQGIPIYRTEAIIEDAKELPRRPWARLGGKGTFIELEGTKAASIHIYVVEIPPGGALEPEKHLYDELLLVLRGRGLTEVWHEGQSKVSFEWGEGSLFAIPLNAWHRLVNGGREPVLIYAETSAPVIMNTLRNTEFVFNCPYNFTDRFSGQSDFFLTAEKRYKDMTIRYQELGPSGENMWETNFIPDVRTCFLERNERAMMDGEGGGARIRMTAWTWNGMSVGQAPVGRYSGAHYHGPGAVLVGLTGEGYSLLWHRQYGIHPYQDGHSDKVLKIAWKPGSVFSPQDYVFHGHFNTGKEPCRLLRIFGAGTLGLRHPTLARGREGNEPLMTSVRKGGTRIELEDVDPEIHHMYEEALRQKGVKLAMPRPVYRTDSFKPYWL